MLFKRPPAVWSEADVLRVEDRLGQRLPGAFRTHLLSVGAGELVERIVPGTEHEDIGPRAAGEGIGAVAQITQGAAIMPNAVTIASTRVSKPAT